MLLKIYFYVIILGVLNMKMLYLLLGAEIFHADFSMDNVQSRNKFSQICFALLFAGYLYTLSSVCWEILTINP